MKQIKVFLASSINEFKEERNVIGNFIRQIQDELIDYDIRIKLFECEFFDNNITIIGRKQEEYNEEIRKSDIFVMLIGKKIGKYTLEEYRVAKEVNGLKKCVVFKKSESNETVNLFKNEIQNVVISYEYSNFIELKYIIANIILENIKNQTSITVNKEEILIENKKIKLGNL